MAAEFLSACNLFDICHITNSFYRRMMHEKDEQPPNEKQHANQFSITYNGCDFCLLTPPAILAFPKCLSVNSWFHLPKILFLSLQFKLFDIAQR